SPEEDAGRYSGREHQDAQIESPQRGCRGAHPPDATNLRTRGEPRCHPREGSRPGRHTRGLEERRPDPGRGGYRAETDEVEEHSSHARGDQPADSRPERVESASQHDRPGRARGDTTLYACTPTATCRNPRADPQYRRVEVNSGPC